MTWEPNHVVVAVDGDVTARNAVGRPPAMMVQYE